jgi:signal transduction histidine kinase
LLTIPVLVFALVFTAHEIMVFSMRQVLDDSLKKRADLTANAISPIVSANPGSYAQTVKQLTEDQLPSIPLLLRVSDGNEYVLASFGDIPASILPRLNALLSSANADEGGFHTISVKGEESLRVYTVALETPAVSEPEVLIQTADSLSHIAVAENQLWRYGLGAGTAGTVLILGVGFFILQQGFRPIDRILRRVEEIGRGNLQAGLPEEPRPPELQQLANSLNTMWQRLDEVFNVREAFFASVSHGLRSPLTALQGQIDVLLMSQSVESEVRDSLGKMGREVRGLVRMTDDLLLKAQLESNPGFTLARVNLRELLEEVVWEIWALSEDLELDLPGGEDILVSGDYDLLKQMVLNIVDNAIKYTEKGERIKLSLDKTKDRVTLEVSDTGRGIPANDLPRVIEPFYRSEASRRSGMQGTGLGLAIVKSVVELHDGHIEIQSQVGVGTRVRVSLPRLSCNGQWESMEHLEASGMKAPHREASDLHRGSGSP